MLTEKEKSVGTNEIFINSDGLSLRGGGRGFPPSTMNVAPALVSSKYCFVNSLVYFNKLANNF